MGKSDGTTTERDVLIETYDYFGDLLRVDRTSYKPYKVKDKRSLLKRALRVAALTILIMALWTGAIVMLIYVISIKNA